ncbi:universal stress protein [Pseudomonas baetica]|uniref:universal stress protein n=1 Tax=Pseudomonas baetica TaxID=674054 RepID=UPI003EEF8244
MSQYQRLFLIVGPNMRHTPAMERAVALAKATGAMLHIAVFIENVDTLGLMSGDEHFLERCQEENQKWLQDEAQLIRGHSVAVTTEVILTRDVLQEILQHVKDLQPDLVIKDVHHESTLKRVFATPLDWHLVRDCPVAVHLVSEVRCPLPRVIVAAVDLSHPDHPITEFNDRIILTAQRMATQCNAELHLLHAFDPSRTHITDAGAGAVTMPGFSSDVRRALHKSFTALADSYHVATERQHFIEGAPAKVMSDYAAHSRADVIIMGSTHRKGLHKLMGSTTEHVLHKVPCNVLAIPSL